MVAINFAAALTLLATSTSAAAMPAAAAPSNCLAYYLVQQDNTCVGIANKFSNFTTTAFYSWNPDSGRSCTGLLYGTYVCVGVPGYTYIPTRAGDIFPESDKPAPIYPSSVANCQKWVYTDATGKPEFSELLRANRITEAQYSGWNNGTFRWASYFSCVGV